MSIYVVEKKNEYFVKKFVSKFVFYKESIQNNEVHYDDHYYVMS